MTSSKKIETSVYGSQYQKDTLKAYFTISNVCIQLYTQEHVCKYCLNNIEESNFIKERNVK